MKRTWITVKRGILEPKHRFALGELIYLFMFILDKTNWESGVIEDWLDQGVAEEMEMPLSTVRYQRRKLERLGYISTEQKQHGIRVIVHNWTNPKEYTGKKYNVKSISDNPSDNPSDNEQALKTDSTFNQKSKNKTQKEKEVVFPASLNTDEFVSAWQEWKQYRSQIHKKLTDMTQDKQLKQLEKFGSDVAVAMIEQSIARGWQGLFELRKENEPLSLGIRN